MGACTAGCHQRGKEMTNALKPIGYGKKILSVEEALKGLEGYNPPTAPPPAEEPDSESDDTSQSLNFENFGIGDIVLNNMGDFEYQGLLTSDGLWDIITLAHEQYDPDPSGKGAIKTYDQHIAHSNASHCTFRITPSKIRYAMMRGAYELRNTKNAKTKAALKVVKEAFIKDGTKPWQHNAEEIMYTSGQLATITTKGWPKGHPFMQSYNLALAGPNSMEIMKGCGLDVILGSLIGDSSSERVKEIMEWYYTPSSAITRFYRESRTYSGKRVVVFGVSIGSGAFIVAINYVRRPARGVNADAKNFHRK